MYAVHSLRFGPRILLSCPHAGQNHAFTQAGTPAAFDLLDSQALILALSLGLVKVAGAYVGGAIINRVSDKAFVYIVEIVIVGAAIALLVR
ncbi:MAG: hypothetical protein OXE02_05550 [Chloroflexi bacterium]|nr:hypothetical protein [Chloroflexota bacterium]